MGISFVERNRKRRRTGTGTRIEDVIVSDVSVSYAEIG